MRLFAQRVHLVPQFPAARGVLVGVSGGVCCCDPQPESSPVGECPDCRKLDRRTVRS